MALLVHGIDDVCHTERKSQIIIEFQIIGISQFHIADAEAINISGVAALVESSPHRDSQSMVIQKIVIAAQFCIC